MYFEIICLKLYHVFWPSWLAARRAASERPKNKGHTYPIPIAFYPVGYDVRLLSKVLLVDFSLCWTPPSYRLRRGCQGRYLFLGFIAFRYNTFHEGILRQGGRSREFVFVPRDNKMVFGGNSAQAVFRELNGASVASVHRLR